MVLTKMKGKNELPRRNGIISNSGVKKPLVIGERDHSCLEEYHFPRQMIRNGPGVEII